MVTKYDEAQSPIPLLRVRGSYHEVGLQIGDFCREAIQRTVRFEPLLPAGRTRAAQLRLAAEYLEATRRSYPWVLEELDGIAEGASVPFLDLFACLVEEIWRGPTVASRQPHRGCTDLVAASPMTDGRVLIAHNNDLPARHRADIVAIERDIPGDPLVLTIGTGIWISVGWNSQGISLTGNSLHPNDERVGIPREVQVRAMLREETVGGMVEVAIHPDRASSYNHVIASADGMILDLEGSATDHEMLLADRGVLAHTNHYVCQPMLRYEGDLRQSEDSAVRLARASELLGRAEPASVDAALLKGVLSDHMNAPTSICRHASAPDESATVFWCIADVTEGIITFGRGGPCSSNEQTFRFGDYPTI